MPRCRWQISKPDPRAWWDLLGYGWEHIWLFKAEPKRCWGCPTTSTKFILPSSSPWFMDLWNQAHLYFLACKVDPIWQGPIFFFAQNHAKESSFGCCGWHLEWVWVAGAEKRYRNTAQRTNFTSIKWPTRLRDQKVQFDNLLCKRLRRSS